VRNVVIGRGLQATPSTASIASSSGPQAVSRKLSAVIIVSTYHVGPADLYNVHRRPTLRSVRPGTNNDVRSNDVRSPRRALTSLRNMGSLAGFPSLLRGPRRIYHAVHLFGSKIAWERIDKGTTNHVTEVAFIDVFRLVRHVVLPSQESWPSFRQWSAYGV